MLIQTRTDTTVFANAKFQPGFKLGGLSTTPQRTSSIFWGSMRGLHVAHRSCMIAEADRRLWVSGPVAAGQSRGKQMLFLVTMAIATNFLANSAASTSKWLDLGAAPGPSLLSDSAARPRRGLRRCSRELKRPDSRDGLSSLRGKMPNDSWAQLDEFFTSLT
jgi:hypothetical protein